MFILLLLLLLLVFYLWVPRSVPGIRHASGYTNRLLGHLPLVWHQTCHLNEQCLADAVTDPITPYQHVLPTMRPMVTIPPSPAIARWILSTNFQGYGKDPRIQACYGELFGQGIFAQDGAQWRRQRKIAARVFTSRYIDQEMLPVFRVHATRLCQSLQSGLVYDMQQEFRDLTMSTTMAISFGDNDVDTGVGTAFDHVNSAMFTRVLFPLWWMFPYSARENRIRRSIRTIDLFCADHIRRLRGLYSSTERPVTTNLVFQWLRHGGENGKDSEIRDVIVNFLVAGRDTTATALT